MESMKPENTATVIEATVERDRGRRRVAAVAGVVALLAVGGTLWHLAASGQDDEAPASEPVDTTAKAGRQRSRADVERIRARLLGTETKKPRSNLSEEERVLLDEVFQDETKEELSVQGVGGEGPGDIAASLTDEVVMRVVRERRGALTACAATAVRRGEEPPPRLEIAIVVYHSGRVADVNVLGRARSRHPVLADCCLRRIQDWRFPRFRGSTQTVRFAVEMTED